MGIHVDLTGTSKYPFRFRVSGELDIMSAATFKTVFLLYISNHIQEVLAGIPLTLDLLGLKRLDCEGVGAIVAGYNLAKEANPKQPIHVLAAGEVARMLETCKLDKVLCLKGNITTTTRSYSDPDAGDGYYKNSCRPYI